MREVTLAALQLALGHKDPARNIEAVSALVEDAAARGAHIVLPPELFAGPYFCAQEDEAHFAAARPMQEHPSVLAMQKLAKSLSIAIPTSFFERCGPHYYNALAMIGPDGDIMGRYRKSHIPDGPGYEEKFYFRPGNDGFKVWQVPCISGVVRLGVGVCWDQWYPESARVMALMGAEVLAFPTAIGTEPHAPELDTSRMWQRAMQGHAVSNCMSVMAANRIGQESVQSFYGHSFITNEWGDKLTQLGEAEEGALIATIDLDQAARNRAGMGFFRDRRPELYEKIVEGV